MIKFSELIGALVSDVSNARKIADSTSVALSQSYHADPFLKGMPVPHYTIDEAEIKVPVSISGVFSNNKDKTLKKSHILSAIKLKLPQLLNDQLISYYIEKCKQANEDKEEILQSKIVIDIDGTTVSNDNKTDEESIDVDTQDNVEVNAEFTTDVRIDLKEKYAKSAQTISNSIHNLMSSFLNSANFEIIKLLDIKDKFESLLVPLTTNEFSSYDFSDQPLSEDTYNKFANEIGTSIFFEFQQFCENYRGVFIEENTGKLNEYSSKDNLMYVTLKIKEQDLDIIVEDVDGSGNQKFLSIN